MSRKRLDPIPPGEILREESMRPLGITVSALARDIGVPANRISEIVAERRHVTADTALRLSAALGTTPEFWLNLQQAYDLRNAEKELGPGLRSIKPVRKVG